MVEQAQILVARKDFPAADLREFVAYAKAHPTLVYGSACVMFQLFSGAIGQGDIGEGETLQARTAGLGGVDHGGG